MGYSPLCHALTWAIVLLYIVIPLVASQSLPDLRIMPLGDSITKGNGASDGNGYRKRLRQKLLAYDDSTVDMIGTQKSPKMPVDGDHQGHSGKYLAQIREFLKLSIAAQPNIVLVHAGTNNMDKQIDLGIATDLIEGIMDDIWKGSPKAVVLVMPVIWANDPGMQRRTDTFNAQLGTIIKRKQGAGQHVLSVPTQITAGDLSDRKHPNDQGYEKMAVAWFNGILEAHERGWISQPTKVDASKLPSNIGLGSDSNSGGGGVVDGSCGTGNWEAQGKVFDGISVWEEVGIVMTGPAGASRDKVILADLNNDGLADYILAYDGGAVSAWINGGKPNQWTSLGSVNPAWTGVRGDMVRMVDVDGDGKADMIALYKDGKAKVWKNVDNGKKFEALDPEWATRDEHSDIIHFQDIDGDGYADYVLVYSGGAVKWAQNSHNNGKDSDRVNWEGIETIAPGPAGMPANRASIQDIDGDGLADYLVIYEGGAVRAWSNTGALNDGGGDRSNWDSLGTIVPGVSGVTGDMIRFADMDGDGLPDFLAVSNDGSIRMWKNNGIVGSKGRAIRFAKVSATKGVDIVVVDHNGRARAWVNRGQDKWDDVGEIAPGLDEDLTSSRIEFHDINGDGLDDYLVIYGGGAVKGYLNNGNIGKDNGNRLWSGPYTISPGVGERGRKVSFADLNGDGCSDFLVIYDGGAVNCWLNTCPKSGSFPPSQLWRNKETIATGVGESSSKIRFADINGDGLDDYIIQYSGGSAKAFNNTGNIPDRGRVRNWANLGTVASGMSSQGMVYYADIDGDGKADYLTVSENGAVYAYLNTCNWKPPFVNLPGNGGGGGGGGLNGDSSCDEVTEHDESGDFPADLWDQTDAGEYLTNWLTYDDDATGNVAKGFASDWGTDSLDCTVHGDCDVPDNCHAYNTEKGSGRAHLIMKAMKNLQGYYHRLDEAIDSAGLSFAILQEALSRYFPGENLEDVGLAQLFSNINGIVDTFTTFAGDSAGVELGSGMYGVVSGAIESALTTTDGVIDKTDQLSKVAAKFISSARAAIEDINNSLLGAGQYEPEEGGRLVLDELFRDGRWLDTRQIPVLNTNSEYDSISSIELGDFFANFLHAAILDYSWKGSIVTIIGHAMTKEEYDEGAGSSDFAWDQMTYYDGWGYVLLSMEPTINIGETTYTQRDPPGFKNLADLNVTFSVTDVIRSSIDTHEKYGYSYDQGANLDDLISNPNWQTWRDLTPRQVGTFNIPVCYLKTESGAGFFWKVVGSADTIDPSSRFGNYALCLCSDMEDQNGKKWRDQLNRNDALNDCSPDWG